MWNILLQGDVIQVEECKGHPPDGHDDVIS